MVSTVSMVSWLPRRDMGVIHREARSLECACLTQHILAKAFRTAVLLTGAIGPAEAAVLEAIGRLDPEQISDDAFLMECVRASRAPGRQCKTTIRNGEDLSSILAPELMRILLLDPHLRHALVLRVLLGLSDDDCARLNMRNAGQRACAAVQELARLRQAERGATA
jgi:hypothetical protein